MAARIPRQWRVLVTAQHRPKAGGRRWGSRRTMGWYGVNATTAAAARAAAIRRCRDQDPAYGRHRAMARLANR